jgi:diacylglycerol kinase (ATP)
VTDPWAAGATRRLTLLVNPTAGGGRALRHAGVVERRLRQAGAVVEVRPADSAQALRAHADEAVAAAHAAGERGEPHAVVAVGGDGTVHTVLQSVGDSGVPFGVVASGSGDDAARAWGLPRAQPDQAAAVLLTGHPRPYDLTVARTDDGRVLWFGTVVAAGFDARVSERALALRRVPAVARYVAAVAAELRRLRPLDYSLVIDGVPQTARGMLVAVANSPSYGGGMLVCPDARPDDGLLDVLLLDTLPTIDFVRVFPRVYRGTHVSHPAVHVRRATEVRVDARDVLAFADGEPLAPLPLTIGVRPGRLSVLGGAPPP